MFGGTAIFVLYVEYDVIYIIISNTVISRFYYKKKNQVNIFFHTWIFHEKVIKNKVVMGIESGHFNSYRGLFIYLFLA
jgi:hypothetical protein